MQRIGIAYTTTMLNGQRRDEREAAMIGVETARAPKDVLPDRAKLAIRDYMKSQLAFPAIVIGLAGAFGGYLLQEVKDAAVSKAKQDEIDRTRGQINDLLTTLRDENAKLAGIRERNEEVRVDLQKLREALPAIKGEFRLMQGRALNQTSQDIVPDLLSSLRDPRSGFVAQVAEAAIPNRQWPTGSAVPVRINSVRNSESPAGNCPSGSYVTGVSVVDGDKGDYCRGCISAVVIHCRFIR